MTASGTPRPHPSSASAAVRTFMLLQGPRSPFFAHLAAALADRGARVERVLLCAGDELFWRASGAHRYRGSLDDWPAWVGSRLNMLGVTDVLGLGHGRAHHEAAFEIARSCGVRVHVVEQGWLRPNWLTVERDALGSWTPQGADEAALPPIPQPPPWRQRFATFAAMDVAHHLANAALNGWLYPHYRPHELWSPWAEWRGWGRRAFESLWRRPGDAAARRAIEAASGPVFLLALQLDTDFQMREHGPPGGVAAVIEQVLSSFAAHAPAEASLLVRPHPLDPFPWRWRRRVAARGAIWFEGGSVEAVWRHLAGVVTVNSTVGLSALLAGVPVIALGKAVYDRLCAEVRLDAFWRAPFEVDSAAVARFTALLARDTQVHGAFDGEGMAPGARAVADRLLRQAVD